MTKKQFQLYMLVSFGALIIVIILLLSYLNKPAVLGEMTVTSGDEKTTVYSNTIAIVEDGETTEFDEAILSEIIDDIPSIDIGETFSVKYSEDYIDDDMLYSMYYENLEPMYENTTVFVMPHESGSFVIKMICSWGSSDKEKITMENYFIVNYG